MNNSKKSFLKKLLLTFVIICLVLLPIFTISSQTDTEDESTNPIPSYLGINLGMTRDSILDGGGNFISEEANVLELVEYVGEADETLITAKAIPFINKIYFQFVKDPNDGDTPKLYEILIQFNELYVGYYQLLDMFSKGFEYENPDFDPSIEESESNTRIIKSMSYGEPDIVQPQKAVWNEYNDAPVKIILTKSNKINRFGPVVSFIHKEGLKLVRAINNPKSETDISSIEFTELTPASGETLITIEQIAKIGRGSFLLSALMPQQTETDEDDE